jgi:hypothetical protein
VLVPMMMLVASLVVVTSHFFSALHSLQEIVDSETQHIVARQGSSAELEAAMRRRVAAAGVAAELLTLVHSGGAAGDSRARWTTVEGRYHAPLLAVLNSLIPSAPLYIPFSIETAVRRLSAASLIVLDATVPAASTGCTDPDLIYMERLASTLSQELQRRSATRVVAAVLPRGLAPLEEISIAGGPPDAIPRCAGQQLSGGPALTFAIKGETTARSDPPTLSAQVTALLSSRVLSGPEEITSVAFILRHAMQDDGTAAALVEALEAEAHRQKRKVRAIVRLVGATTNYQETLRTSSRYGLEVQRIYGPRENAGSFALVHAAVSMMSDRIVVAQ